MVRSSTSTVVKVRPALLSRDGASVGPDPVSLVPYSALIGKIERSSSLIIGDTRFAIPPRLSCSASCNDVLHPSVRLANELGHDD